MPGGKGPLVGNGKAHQPSAPPLEKLFGTPTFETNAPIQVQKVEP